MLRPPPRRLFPWPSSSASRSVRRLFRFPPGPSPSAPSPVGSVPPVVARASSILVAAGNRPCGRAASSLAATMSTSKSSGGGDGSDAPAAVSAPEAVPEAVPEGHELITEGQISMLYPKSENSVFYNPVQVQNRDLSVLMIGMHAERRTERMWTKRRRREVGRELHEARKRQEEEDAKSKEGGAGENGGEGGGGKGGGGKKETKEERKSRAAKFESDLASRIAQEKTSVDFAQLTKESSRTSDGMSVFEALAASGLRSLRYWREVPGIRSIVINDLDPVAVDMARENVRRNGLEGELASEGEDADAEAGANANGPGKDGEKEGDGAGEARPALRPPGITLQAGDCTHEMYLSRRPPALYPSQMNPSQLHQKPQFDVIDLDPYGSAAPYLDAAVQSVVDGGMLAVTCTDMVALGGSHPETCYGRYAGFPIQRAGYLQELALRILLYHVSVVAGRYGRSIRPVLSVGMAFYCRVFLEVHDDKAGVNNLSLNHGHLFQSIRCSSFHIMPVATNDFVAFQQRQKNGQEPEAKEEGKGGGDSEGGKKAKGRKAKRDRPSNVYRAGRGPCSLDEPVCAETGGGYKIAGPLWTGALHDMDFVNDAVARLEAAMGTEDGVDPSGGVPIFPLHTSTALHGLLVAVSEELPDAPLYHLLPSLCSAVNSATIPSDEFRAALVNAGYRVSAYHKEPNAVKTDAPNSVVWDVVRAWCRDHPPAKRKESKRDSHGGVAGATRGAEAPAKSPHVDVATRILSREIGTEISFEIPRGFRARKKARRWGMNPEANWGPKKAASGRNRRGET